MREPEEVDDRHRDARLGRVVVEHLEQQAAQALGRRRRDGHPQVTDDSRPVDVREHDPLAGPDAPVRCALPSAVCGPARAAGTRGVLERDRAGIEPWIDDGGVTCGAVEHGREPRAPRSTLSLASVPRSGGAGAGTLVRVPRASRGRARRHDHDHTGSPPRRGAGAHLRARRLRRRSGPAHRSRARPVRRRRDRGRRGSDPPRHHAARAEEPLPTVVRAVHEPLGGSSRRRAARVPPPGGSGRGGAARRRRRPALARPGALQARRRTRHRPAPGPPVLADPGDRVGHGMDPVRGIDGRERRDVLSARQPSRSVCGSS